MGKIYISGGGNGTDDLAAHNISLDAHQDIRNLIANLTGRVQRMEDMLITNITSNPYLVDFASLEGLTVTGVWNAGAQRIEF